MHRDIFGAQAVGLRTIMFDSDQGTKEHPDTAPDHTISDHRELLDLLGLPRPG
jgi:putative hydrolase of the HAD superfamily